MSRTASGITLGRRTFEFIDAPGHARHHHCPIDLDHREVYSGDNFGICYREFDTARGAFMLPTTTPVQFDPDALHATIDRMLSYRPQRIYQTHFGPVTDLERLAADLHAAIVELVRIARVHAAAPDRRERIEADMFRYFSAQLDAHGYAGDLARRHALLDDDVRLNTSGLEVWLDTGAAEQLIHDPDLLIHDHLHRLPHPRTRRPHRRALRHSHARRPGPGDVVVRVQYSGINYKDALAATGAAPILRKYPLVGGIDLAGEVVSSADPRYAPGQPVLVTGCGLSETHDGGYAEYARLQGEWVDPAAGRHRPRSTR